MINLTKMKEKLILGIKTSDKAEYIGYKLKKAQNGFIIENNNNPYDVYICKDIDDVTKILKDKFGSENQSGSFRLPGAV